MKKKLLIIAHMPSENTRVLGSALLLGASNNALVNVEVKLLSPFECDSEQVLNCDAIILFTTENFGYMSGALKDFFERIYYPCLADPKRNEGKPFALVIRAGLDGTGTDVAVHKITTGLKWKEVQPTMICKGDFVLSFTDQCNEFGLTIAASLDADII